MVIFNLFVQRSEGTTYAVVPLTNKKALGRVAGIVGARGNACAVLAGSLFRSKRLPTPEALMGLGVCFLGVYPAGEVPTRGYRRRTDGA